MIFLVPAFSKAISTRVSLAMGVADKTMPFPNTLWVTVSPGAKDIPPWLVETRRLMPMLLSVSDTPFPSRELPERP